MSQPTPGYTSPYLWPEALIDATCSRRKSHYEVGLGEWGDERPAGAVDVNAGCPNPCPP